MYEMESGTMSQGKGIPLERLSVPLERYELLDAFNVLFKPLFNQGSAHL